MVTPWRAVVFALIESTRGDEGSGIHNEGTKKTETNGEPKGAIGPRFARGVSTSIAKPNRKGSDSGLAL